MIVTQPLKWIPVAVLRNLNIWLTVVGLVKNLGFVMFVVFIKNSLKDISKERQQKFKKGNNNAYRSTRNRTTTSSQ